jgi:hypothetical protein
LWRISWAMLDIATIVLPGQTVKQDISVKCIAVITNTQKDSF